MFVEHAEDEFEGFLRVLATFLQLGHLVVLLFLQQLTVLLLADIESDSARDSPTGTLNCLKAFLDEAHRAFGHFIDSSRPSRPSLILLKFSLIALTASHRIGLMLSCANQLVLLRGFGGSRSGVLGCKFFTRAEPYFWLMFFILLDAALFLFLLLIKAN